jgi:hypothetical protein
MELTTLTASTPNGTIKGRCGFAASDNARARLLAGEVVNSSLLASGGRHNGDEAGSMPPRRQQSGANSGAQV